METVVSTIVETDPNKTDEDGPQQQITPLRPSPSDARHLHLFYQPPGTLRLTIEDTGTLSAHSYPVVRLYQAAPLTMPNRYIALQDGKGEEIVLLSRLEDFSPEALPTVQEELRRRYLTARVTEVRHIKTEFGVTYWTVNTDRGERDFVVQSLSESCVWLSDTHMLITDVDGNRFEIVDRNALDADSREQLASVL